MPLGSTDLEPFDDDVDRLPAVSVRVRTARPSPAVPISVALIVAFLGLAIIKPWGGTASPSEDRGRSAPPRPATLDQPSGVAGPTPVVDREQAIADECHAPYGWRIVTNERWQGREVRIWWAVSPVESKSAFNPSIPFLSIVSDAILQLGYCAPLFAPDRPASTESVGIWRIDPEAQTAEAIHPTQIAPPFDDSVVAIWAPPGSATAGDVSWPTGRYVFGVGGRWFGVDLRILNRSPAASASAGAGGSPSASGSPAAGNSAAP
jgi:hypothetical protein